MRKRRAVLATLMSMSAAERENLCNSSVWAGMHDRLSALLDLLETAGCFILRRGTIESYYQFSSPQGTEGKPTAAVGEVEGFMQQDEGVVEANYADILRSLRFAAAAEPIDEVRALRELLLGIAAAALGDLSEKTSEDELNMSARRLVGEKSSLLRLVPKVGDGGIPELEIHLNSSVLDVRGFPIRLQRGCNPVAEIDRQLGL
jgi:hypothetical protein